MRPYMSASFAHRVPQPRLHYSVVTAHDGYEAIRVLAERHIDLLIVDIQMPGHTVSLFYVSSSPSFPRSDTVCVIGGISTSLEVICWPFFVPFAPNPLMRALKSTWRS